MSQSVSWLYTSEQCYVHRRIFIIISCSAARRFPGLLWMVHLLLYLSIVSCFYYLESSFVVSPVQAKVYTFDC